MPEQFRPEKNNKMEDLGLPKPFEHLPSEPAMPEKKVAQPERTAESFETESTPEVESARERVEMEPMPTTSAAAGPVDGTRREVERIMSEGLEDAYQKMTPSQRQTFKQEGEETASKISAMLRKGRVRLAKIINLLRKWLSLIPGVNKFYLEQAAKIKADKISHIGNREGGDEGNVI